MCHTRAEDSPLYKVDGYEYFEKEVLSKIDLLGFIRRLINHFYILKRTTERSVIDREIENGNLHLI